MTEEERSWKVRSRARIGYGGLPINVLKLFDMGLAASMMIMIERGVPKREGEAVVIRRDSVTAVRWMFNCDEREI